MELHRAALLWRAGAVAVVPKERARREILKLGRHLSGPKLVTTAEFNTTLGVSKRLMLYLPDGVAFAKFRLDRNSFIIHART